MQEENDFENEVEPGADSNGVSLDYELPKGFIPKEFQEFSLDNVKFAELMRKHGAPKDLAEKLWQEYLDTTTNNYNKYIERQVEDVRAQEELRQQEQLNKLEQHVDSFDGYHPTIEEASALAKKLRSELIRGVDAQGNKLLGDEYSRARARVEHFERYAAGLESSLDGWLLKYEQGKAENLRQLHGAGWGQPKHSAYGQRPPEHPVDEPQGQRDLRSAYIPGEMAQ